MRCQKGQSIQTGTGPVGNGGHVFAASFLYETSALGRAEIRMEVPLRMELQKRAALVEALRVGIDACNVIQCRSRKGQQIVLYLHVPFADDEGAILMDEVVYVCNATGRGIFYGNDAIAGAALDNGLHDILKVAVVRRNDAGVCEIRFHSFVCIRPSLTETGDADGINGFHGHASPIPA